MSKSLEIVPAGEGDLDVVLAVLEEAAEWLVWRALRDRGGPASSLAKPSPTK